MLPKQKEKAKNSKIDIKKEEKEEWIGNFFFEPTAGWICVFDESTGEWSRVIVIVIDKKFTVVRDLCNNSEVTAIRWDRM